MDDFPSHSTPGSGGFPQSLESLEEFGGPSQEWEQVQIKIGVDSIAVVDVPHCMHKLFPN